MELIGLSHRLDVRERKITGDIQMSGLGTLWIEIMRSLLSLRGL